MEIAQSAVDYVRSRWQVRPRVALILGTGLGGFVEEIEAATCLSYGEIPEFPCPTVEGHDGKLVCGTVAGTPIVAMSGRSHLYEGHSCEAITLPVRLMRRLGAGSLVVSNASGGINPRLRSGELLAIAEHINLLGPRSLLPTSESQLTPRRSPLYDRRLIDAAQCIARRHNLTLHRGVYVAVLGPNYETRAEYRAFRKMGGDVVGMSTVPEASVAASCGMRVLAISMVTNVACPDSLAVTYSEDVVNIAAKSEPNLRILIRQMVAEGALTEDAD